MNTPPPTDSRPTLGITMGDPAGVGAEIIVKALADPEIRHRARFVVFGLNELMAYAADLAEIEPFWWRDQHDKFPIMADATGGYVHDVVVLDYDEYSILGVDVKAPTKQGGAASMQFCQDAIAAALKHRIDGIVTAPICKESWKMAGFDRWPGHTELLAEKTKAKRHAMMFAAPPETRGQGVGVRGQTENGNGGFKGMVPGYKGLRVVLCTIHEALFELRNSFKIGTVYDPIDLANTALKEWFGIERPRIAVCGLNPHAGENGQFGDEEKRIIEPAIMMARQQGRDVHGPFPADTIFIKAAQGQYDIVVAMYHDQGLIPVKLLDSAGSVNLTLGLPIVRTSPDHGTAFDIVGKNKADASSIKAAIIMAAEIAGKVKAKRGANGAGGAKEETAA